MSNYEALRGELLALFPRVLEVARVRAGAESVQRLTAAQQRLREGRLTAVVCGEFKRGKSSLLGALLEEPDLFPVDVDIATSMVSMISYGATERITVTLAEDGTDVARTITRAEIPAYVTERENPRNAKDVRLLTIQAPNQRLASGLTLVDTPGVGALNSEHTAVTYAFLPNADAVIFVGDATAPLTETELEFVRRISEHCAVILFVITKIDVRNDYEQVVANTRAKLGEVTGQPAGELVVIPVSSAAKLAYLESKDDEDLELSNFPAFEHALRQAVEHRRGQLLLTRAVTDLDRVTGALMLPVRTELQALQQASEAELAELAAKLAAKQHRAAELKHGHAAWRQELRTRLTKVHQDIRVEMSTGITRIWQRLPTSYLRDERLVAEPGQIIDALNADVGLLLGSITQSASQRAAVIQDQLEHQTGLGLERRQVGAAELPPIEMEIVPTPATDTSGDRRMRKLRDLSLSSGLGSSIGGLIGGLLGGPLAPITGALGAVVGGLIAGSLGYRNAVKSIHQRDQQVRRHDIAVQVAPLQNLHRAEADRAVEEVFSQFRSAIEADLDAKIRLEQESLTAALRSLWETKSRAAEEATARIQELTRQARVLEQAQQYCATAVDRLTPGTTPTGPTPDAPAPARPVPAGSVPASPAPRAAAPDLPVDLAVFDDPGRRAAGTAG
ncbi:MAG: dynamin family protein [Pseudonocardiales bacterium]|nr:dynamin family protein [Pseudonocardiales bacterium]